jgi:hypothetical protein
MSQFVHAGFSRCSRYSPSENVIVTEASPMKFITGLSAVLLGTTLLAGAAAAADPQNSNPPPPSHPHFSASGHSHGTYGGHAAPEQVDRSTPRGNFSAGASSNANATTTANPGSWAAAHGAHVTTSAPNNHGGNWNQNAGGNWNHNGGSWNNGSSHGHWNSNNLHDHNVSHFNTQDRAAWQHGHWQHGRHHGRDGWWWNSGGTWFFYDQPTYPYPGYVSDYYYSDDFYDGGDDGYASDAGDPGYGAAPGDGGYYWYYCNNPAGYYPYVKSCRGPWRAVTPTPDAQQGGYDQNDSPDADDDDDRGPPPGYNDNGPRGGDQFNGPDDDQGPPPGYDDGPDDDNGPPPPPR